MAHGCHGLHLGGEGVAEKAATHHGSQEGEREEKGEGDEGEAETLNSICPSRTGPQEQTSSRQASFLKAFRVS